MTRPRSPLLSHDRIVAAALALVDAEGMEALSTRRLAAELGVSGPSLYNHFATKDELIDAVVDAVLGEVDISMFPDPDWRSALERWARSYRAVLAAHPHIVPALAYGRPNYSRLTDAAFRGLVAAGWPRAEAASVGALIRHFIIGSALACFAGGFPADAAVYEGNPNLGQADLLSRQRRIDEFAFDCGLHALLHGLTACPVSP